MSLPTDVVVVTKVFDRHASIGEPAICWRCDGEIRDVFTNGVGIDPDAHWWVIVPQRPGEVVGSLGRAYRAQHDVCPRDAEAA